MTGLDGGGVAGRAVEGHVGHGAQSGVARTGRAKMRWMDEKARTRLSKFLSYVLRHEPGSIGLALDAQGWAEIDELLARARAHGRAFTREALDEVVAESPKRRFAVSEDGRRVRASQGHSLEVDLGYVPAE